ncbi:hypothetical protein F5Y12DRAFT_360616 [Xylaria sp. FL1777]|nr:hypothetical protein F5Y12DRAFT_360616 [Xylaria sp. FL1777]
MVAHKRSTLGGTYSLTTSSQKGFQDNALFQTDARTRNPAPEGTMIFRRKVMKHADAPLVRDGLFTSDLGSRSAHPTSNSYGHDSPHPPPPPDPPVPNPSPPSGNRVCWW